MTAATMLRFHIKSMGRHPWIGAGLVAVFAATALAVYLAETNLVPQALDWRGNGSMMERVAFLTGYCVMAAVGIFYLNTGLRGFTGEAALLTTLPLRPATRLRGLAACLFVESLHLWILFAAAIGWALIRAAGRLGWLWLACLPAILACGAYLGVALRLAVLGGTWRKPRSLALGIAVASLAIILRLSIPGEDIMIDTSHGLVLLCLPLSWMAALLAWGPGGRVLGDRYHRVFLEQAQATSRPTSSQMTRMLAPVLRMRNPSGAFLMRAILCRSRRWFNGIRLLLCTPAILAYPWLEARLHAFGFSQGWAACAVIVGLAFFLMVDGAANPVGSEANRLPYLLTAPLSPRGILLAKLRVYLLGFLVFSVLTAAGIGASGSLPWPVLSTAWVQAFLIVLGLSVWFVFGSSFDMNPARELGSGLTAMLHEEGPTTPVAMALVVGAMGLLALQLATVYHFSPRFAIPLLMLLNAVIGGGTSRLAMRKWAALSR